MMSMTSMIGKPRMLAVKLGLAGVAGLALAAAAMLAVSGVSSAQGTGIFQATLEEPDQKTAEISTENLRRILADGSAIVLDSRKYSEYATSHIPGARNVATEPGAAPEAYTGPVWPGREFGRLRPGMSLNMRFGQAWLGLHDGRR